MELTDDLKAIFTETTEQLQGWARRTFIAQVANLLGKGGQRQAEAELSWCRDTIRKGQHELAGGFCYIDHFSERGREPAEEHLPNLLDDIEAIADEQSQTDPTFKSTRLYTRLSAAEVQERLILQKGYNTVLNFAETMTWNGRHPVVKLVEKTYHTGVSLTKKAMDKLEERFERLSGLEKWFVRIEPLPL